MECNETNRKLTDATIHVQCYVKKQVQLTIMIHNFPHE